MTDTHTSKIISDWIECLLCNDYSLENLKKEISKEGKTDKKEKNVHKSPSFDFFALRHIKTYPH